MLVGRDKSGKGTVVSVTANHLTYRDSEGKAHFEGAVMASSSDLTIASNQMDGFRSPEGMERRAPVLSGAEESQPVPARRAGQAPASPKPPRAAPPRRDNTNASRAVGIT